MPHKIIAVALALATLAAAPALSAQPKAATVHIAMFAFGPQALTISPGTTVTWVNDDDDAHSVVSNTAACSIRRATWTPADRVQLHLHLGMAPGANIRLSLCPADCTAPTWSPSRSCGAALKWLQAAALPARKMRMDDNLEDPRSVACGATAVRRGPTPSARAASRRSSFRTPTLPAYNLALRLTRQAETAEDIVHDAFLRALTAFGGYRGGDARAWILRIVRNRAYDWLRERRRRPTSPLTLVAPDDPDQDLEFDFHDPDQETPEQALVRKGEAASLRALIDALPPRLREVLVLREMEELSYREIAEITDSPIGSVMSRLARARAQIGDAWRRLQDQTEGRAR